MSITLLEEWTRRLSFLWHLPVAASQIVPEGQQWFLSGQHTAPGRGQHPYSPGEVLGQQVSAVVRKHATLRNEIFYSNKRTQA